mgnify:FL=1
MATLHHNISGELTQELLAPGDNVSVGQVTLTNVGTSGLKCKIDLYIEKKLVGKFHLLKNNQLNQGTTLVYDKLRFSNAANEFGLYIKLTKSASETPAVDVVIS